MVVCFYSSNDIGAVDTLFFTRLGGVLKYVCFTRSQQVSCAAASAWCRCRPKKHFEHKSTAPQVGHFSRTATPLLSHGSPVREKHERCGNRTLFILLQKLTFMHFQTIPPHASYEWLSTSPGIVGVTCIQTISLDSGWMIFQFSERGF